MEKKQFFALFTLRHYLHNVRLDSMGVGKKLLPFGPEMTFDTSTS